MNTIRTAVIDDKTKTVINVVEFNGEVPKPLPGQLWIASDDAQIGATYDGETFCQENPKIEQKSAEQVWASIKAERDRRKSGGFKVKVGNSYKWFHSDSDSRIQHLGLKDKARDQVASGGQMTDKLTILGQTVKWKTMDGAFVDVSAQVAFDIVAAAGDLDAQLFAAAETHRAAMEASGDPASYDYLTGWPAIFGE